MERERVVIGIGDRGRGTGRSEIEERGGSQRYRSER